MGGRLHAYDAWVRARPLNAAQQLEVLALIWDKPVGDDVGYVFLPWIPGWAKDKAERRRNWNEGRAFKWPEERDAIHAHLEAHKKDDLYFTPNTFLGDARVAQFTGEEKALYADLDEVDPRELDKDLQPTIAWETSPGRFQGVWLLNQFADLATEAGGLNHRLTAFVHADPSGWDTTQLLRVPGRPNYKFQYKDDEGDSPPGRLLWSEGKVFDVEELDARLPAVEVYATGADIEDHEIDAINARETWYRVRLRVSHTVREYMAMKSRNVTEDYDRSEVMWQIERDLADAGCTIPEIVAIIRNTPWNKHSGRNNELHQLKMEAAKAIGVTMADKAEETLEENVFGDGRPALDMLPTLHTLTSVPIPRPHWLVRNIWARGSCGFISGAPKSYKSYFGLDLAVSVATGTPFLNDPQFSTSTPRTVIYVQEEDSLPLVLHRAEQIVEVKAPDRHWHGQITLAHDITDPASLDAQGLIWTPPTLTDNLVMLVRRGVIISNELWQGYLLDLIEVTNAELMVIDTLGTTVGDIDADKSGPLNEKVLRPLKAISESTGCAIAIVHHNRKSTDSGGRSGQQMLGSVALHAWVESALYVQGKEKLTNSPHSEIKVERENKLAEDLKFRVRVPTMFVEDGAAEEGKRQMWEPEVWMGWAEAEQPEEIKVKDDGTALRSTLLGMAEEFTTDQAWKKHGGQRHRVVEMLNREKSKGFLTGSHTDGWART